MKTMTALFILIRVCSVGAGLILLLGALWFAAMSPAFAADAILAVALIAAGIWPDRWLQSSSQRSRGSGLVVVGLLALAAQIALRATSDSGFASAPIDSWIVNALLIAMFVWRVLFLKQRAVA
jgi:hypothetical protein